jgi:hypothetical protein
VITLTVLAVLILLWLVLRLSGLGGQHGPGRHFGLPAHDAVVAATVLTR